jgi:hypothetical protein
MAPFERASRYVDTLPGAISGSRGHNALFRVACVLVNGFALPDEQAWPILLEYNARCQPPWSQHELRHKLSEVRKVSHLKPLGHLLSEGGKITPQPSSPPRVLGRIILPDTAEGDPGPLTANEQPLVADEPRLAASPPNWATFTGIAQLAAPMTRTRDYLPRSFAPLVELTPAKAPLSSRRIIPVSPGRIPGPHSYRKDLSSNVAPSRPETLSWRLFPKAV